MNRSAWWFTLPLIFGLIGAAIAYAKIRNDDTGMVKWIWIVGIVATLSQTVIMLLGTIIINQAITDMGYISDNLTTGVIEAGFSSIAE